MSEKNNQPIAVDVEEGNDYFWCSCGMSSKQPFCDGSHKGSDFKPLKYTAEKLFSANIREYLGSRRTDKNINNGIKKTAQDQPSDFWAFNNGVTALVHDFKANGKKITIEG